MRYEAKIQGNDNGNQTYNSSFVPESRASGTPWVNITQTDSINECTSLGLGYHLITNAEWTAIARNIEGIASNWSGGSVGSGVMSRGYSAYSGDGDGFTNTQVASTTGTGYEYNTAANTSGPSGDFKFKRTHNLSNGQVVWDLAGNAWEWNNNTCTQGSGTGNWYSTSSYIEWSDSNLADYELGIAGPNPLYTSVQNIGIYTGCVASGNGLLRGGHWSYGLYSGLFTAYLRDLPSDTGIYVGFRCAK
jgi:formylglycine-generating enzyme required for sulfatase activity